MTRRARTIGPAGGRPGPARRPLIAVLALAAAACGGGPEAAAPMAPSPPAPARPATGPAAGSDRIGQFVTRCGFSHRSDADPLVHPHGHGGADAPAPHSHDFFGNTSTDEHTTSASLAASPATTCTLTDDRSAYWAPTLLHDNQPVAPTAVVAYYDTVEAVDPSTVQPLPTGLAMIAGGEPTGPEDVRRAGWTCGKSRELRPGAPVCPSMSPLTLRVTFPDCWDGRAVSSPDHRRHVAYRVSGACPATHPVPVVRLVLDVRYPVHGDPTGLRLASGPMSTAHADVMNAWTERGMLDQVALCIHRRVICGVA